MPFVKRSGANATDVSESREGVPEGAHRQGAEERVQESQNLSLPSNDELEHLRKTDLAYLKARGVGQTGNRDQLLNLAKLYAARPVVEVTPDQNPLPVDPNILWKNAASEIAQIPPSFTLETVVDCMPLESFHALFPFWPEFGPIDSALLLKFLFWARRLQINS